VVWEKRVVICSGEECGRDPGISVSGRGIKGGGAEEGYLRPLKAEAMWTTEVSQLMTRRERSIDAARSVRSSWPARVTSGRGNGPEPRTASAVWMVHPQVVLFEGVGPQLKHGRPCLCWRLRSCSAQRPEASSGSTTAGLD